jgi:dTDP-4-dehydrorhamnose 3,5-epimerase-like enzyme
MQSTFSLPKVRINSVISIPFPRIIAADGQLSVFECGVNVPFDIKRVFTVVANARQLRGDHAHRECAQILVCLSGRIEVRCDDGLGGKSVTQLSRSTDALLVPPGIWASEVYRDDQSVLLVLCDQGYDPDDYIRDYKEFVRCAGAIVK